MNEFLKQKHEKRIRELDQRFIEAWDDFKKIVEYIRVRYKPVRIYKWGSLLNRKHFSYISDIDIAIEGIVEPAEYFSMLGECADLTRFSLDIVQMENIPQIYQDKIKSKGRLIYERTIA